MTGQKQSTPNAAASGTFRIGGEVPVHRLGYGTMRLVGEGAWGEPADAEEAKRVLRRALELGVTLIDTADAYGPEIAERLIGEALAPYAAGVVVATKGGITRQGPAKTEYVGRAGYLIQCVEMSLRRLKLERIELYQLHRIDPRTPLEESLGALARMREQGKIGHIGLSEVSPAEIEEAEKIVPIVTVQNRYSLADRRHEETLNYCERRGIGFLPWYPMPAENCSSRIIRPRRRSAASRRGMAQRWHSSRWRGCSGARPCCCRFRGRRRSLTLKKTSQRRVCGSPRKKPLRLRLRRRLRKSPAAGEVRLRL